MTANAGFGASMIFAALRIFGSASAGSAIGWFISSRVIGLPSGRTLVRRGWSIIILAAPYLLLSIVIAGVDAGVAVLLGMFTGAAVYCAFILRLTTLNQRIAG